RTFVVVEPQPRHAVQDRADRFGRGALDVRIFDSEDELALVMARERPREQRGAGAAEMEEAGGAWCEAGADGGHLQDATIVIRIATCGTMAAAFYRRETGGRSARSRRRCRRPPLNQGVVRPVIYFGDAGAPAAVPTRGPGPTIRSCPLLISRLISGE